MQRREFFGLVASSAAVASTSLVITPGCQRPSTNPAPPVAFVGDVRSFALPDTIEPALTFKPLARRP